MVSLLPSTTITTLRSITQLPLLATKPITSTTSRRRSTTTTKFIIMTRAISTLLSNITTSRCITKSILHLPTMLHAKSAYLGLLGTLGHGTLPLFGGGRFAWWSAVGHETDAFVGNSGSGCGGSRRSHHFILMMIFFVGMFTSWLLFIVNNIDHGHGNILTFFILRVLSRSSSGRRRRRSANVGC